VTVYDAKKIVIESAPLLIFLLALEVLIGQLLNAQESLISIPVILALIPVINGVGGNIGGVLGARLASGLHTGYIDTNLRGQTLKNNVTGTLVMGILAFGILAILLYLILPVLGVSVNVIGFGKLIIIMLGSGILLTITLIILTIFTAIYSFKRGLDPDNYVIPIVTTSGDVLGIVSLLLIVNLIGV
jgi:mgtE-like transporter